MNWVYLDTSAFLKLFLDEPGSEAVAAAASHAAHLAASRLVLTEARVALARYERTGRITVKDFHAALESVDAFWDMEVDVLPLTDAVLEEAERQAQISTLRTLDAIHLATAKLARKTLSRSTSMGFLTFDEELRNAALAMCFLDPLV